MNLSVSFRHRKSSKRVRQVIENRMSSLTKYIKGNYFVRWVFSKDKNGHHSGVVLTNNFGRFYAQASDGQNIYQVIDSCFRKLENQLTKKLHKKRSSF